MRASTAASAACKMQFKCWCNTWFPLGSGVVICLLCPGAIACYDHRVSCFAVSSRFDDPILLMPNMRTAKRASNEEQKQQRLQDIVDAALAICRESSYAELTVAQVAERAGIAKGTVYLYFPSKDALGIALERVLNTAWLEDLRSTLERASWGLSPLQFAGVIGGTVHRHECGFEVLVGLLAAVERTAAPQDLAQVKALLLNGLAASGTRLERLAPYLSAGQGLQLLFFVYAMTVGLHQSMRSTPALDRSLRTRAELRPLQREISWFVAEAIRVHLEGLRAVRTGQQEMGTLPPAPHGLSPEVVAGALVENQPVPRRRRWWELP